MGVLLVILTVAGVVAALGLLLFAVCTDRLWLAKFTAGAAAIWLSFYAVALVGTSITSTEKILEVGDGTGKAFCGFYLDCHLHAAVDDVRTTKSIGGENAKGQFYVVKMTIYSNGKNPSIPFRLLEPNVRVIDEGGEIYVRDEAAEHLLTTSAVRLDQDIRGRETIEKELVFDLPSGVRRPRLDISEGYGIDKVIEAVLIGDEDSLFHPRTYFELPEQSPLAGVK
jgi:hypothetical protein